MQYHRFVSLPDGQTCLLRHPTAEDAEQVLQHLVETSAETNYMARYADEITMTVKQEREYLAGQEDDPREIMISAVVEGKLVANAGFYPVAPHAKYQHRAEFGISIRQEYWGRGIGTALLTAIIEAAKVAGYEQLELEVVAENARGIALYKKMGFVLYGTREKSFRYRDGSYSDMQLMLLRL